MTKTRAPNVQRRSDKSRQATLDTALDMCAELGYRAVTVDALAIRAGVSKATIYRWWSSKGAVVLEAIDEAGIAPREFVETGDLAADLRTQLTGIVNAFTDRRLGPALRGVLADGQFDPGLGRDIQQRLIAPRIAEFNNRMRKARDNGELAPDADLEVAADLLHAPIYRRLMLHYPLPDQSYLDKIIQHVLRALAPI
jgi:AcrR family transcriptional regulator